MNVVRILTTAASITIAAAALAQDEAATSPPPLSPSYHIEPGTQIIFETSGTLRITGDAKDSQDTHLRTKYTVLQKNGPTHTIFASSDQLSSLKNGVTETTASNGARFTFELDQSGEFGERTSGITRDVFASWHPRYDFPQIPADATTTLAVTLPFMDQVAQVSTTRKDEQGNIIVEQKYQPGPRPAWESNGLAIKNFSARYVYSSADKLLVSGSAEIQGGASDPTGKEVAIAWNLHTRRIGSKKLAAAEMDALKNDVLAGAPLLDKVRAALVQGTSGTSEALKLISDYQVKFPKGEFIDAYGDIKKQLSRAAKVAENVAQIAEGKKAPDFSAKTIEGETIRLSSLRGRVVLIDFWATWCGPCVAEVPGLKKLYAEQKDNGFSILGISADQSLDQLREFVKENDVQWKQVYDTDADPDASVLIKYGVNKFPTTILVDREGTIRLIDARGEELAQAVADLVKEK